MDLDKTRLLHRESYMSAHVLLNLFIKQVGEKR